MSKLKKEVKIRFLKEVLRTYTRQSKINLECDQSSFGICQYSSGIVYEIEGGDATDLYNWWKKKLSKVTDEIGHQWNCDGEKVHHRKDQFVWHPKDIAIRKAFLKYQILLLTMKK